LFKYSQNSTYLISTFHSYLSKNVTNTKILDDYDSDSDEYFEDVLPFAFLLDNQIGESEKYDLIIIDEAQDLIKENYLDVFDTILKGGLRDGNFTLYGDFTNQSIYNASKDKLIDLLRSRTYFTTVPELTVNCRNTQKISFQNHLMTRLPKPSNYDTQLDGEEISVIFVNDNNLIANVEAEIQALLIKNIGLEKISILSFRSLLKSSLNNSTKLEQLRSKGLTISTVHGYKGLENTIIFLVDLPDLSDQKSINLLYIGISRARLKLYIFIHETMKGDLRKLLQKHINTPQ
jgi:superfamily I DNA/RNA helicase